ncbi:MAG: FHA domain-containing protein, partial [Bdellovibrionota bacterium]
MIFSEDQQLELPEDEDGGKGNDDNDAGSMSSITEKTTVLREDQTTLNKEIQKAKEQEACLIIIRGSPQGHRFFLTQDEMTIGRDPAADISVSDHGISRKHAKIRKVDGKVFIQDLGTTNGTKVNDR